MSRTTVEMSHATTCSALSVLRVLGCRLGKSAVRPIPILSGAMLLALAGCGRGSADVDRVEAVTFEMPFEAVTEASGLVPYFHRTGAFGEFWFPESMGPGVGVIDYDSNNLPDILVAGGGEWNDDEWRAVWLFRNDGNLRFTDVTDEVGLGSSNTYSMGITVADYDSDGREDFLLSSMNGVQLFRNAGDTFVDVTEETGLSVDRGWATSASFFDADSDGDIDLLVGHYVDWTPDADLWCSNDGTDKTYCTPTLYDGQPMRYYRNDAGVFTDATTEAGFAVGKGKTLGVVAGNIVGSIHPDVYVANDTEPDQLFVNNGDGTFREVGLSSGIAYDERGKSRAGMGVDFGVLDESGRPSLAVGNFAEEMIGVYQRVGEGVFVDRSAALQIGLPSLQTLTFGLAMLDFNLDGWLDLVAANGHVQPEIGRIRDNVTYAEPAHAFANRGDGTFVDLVDADSDVGVAMVARGMAYADFDRDGDPEVIFVENSNGLHLWKNQSVERGATGVVIGLRESPGPSGSSSPMIDAMVEIFVDGRKQERWIKSGGSYLSSSEPAAHFGVSANTLDSVRVTWPDGSVQIEREVAATPFIRIMKGGE